MGQTINVSTYQMNYLVSDSVEQADRGEGDRSAIYAFVYDSPQLAQSGKASFHGDNVDVMVDEKDPCILCCVAVTH